MYQPPSAGLPEPPLPAWWASASKAAAAARKVAAVAAMPAIIIIIIIYTLKLGACDGSLCLPCLQDAANDGTNHITGEHV